MEYPDDLYYTRDHLWIRVVGDRGTIGITDFAQQELGEILFVDLPEKGATFDQSEVFGSLESAKTVAELYTPVSGEVTAVNEDLEDEPSLINDDPYGKGWLISLILGDVKELEDLLTASDYEEYVEKEEKGDHP
jgi:glycine cleavage system H protein